MMKRAAETATRVGDVERAIGSFLDAALIASDAGRTDQVGPMMQLAQVLLASPLLPVNRRAALLQRIEHEPMLAAATPR